PAARKRWEESVERTASFLERRGIEALLAGRAAETLGGRHPERASARAAARAIAARLAHGLAHFGRRVAGPAAPVIDELAQIAAPALVLVGEHDQPYRRAAEGVDAESTR